jgi:hypothetical protein
MTLPQSDIDDTLNTLQNGLTGLRPMEAVSLIDRWHEQLQRSDRQELQQIALDLGELKRHLSTGNLDAKTIGALLQRIGEQTAQAASLTSGGAEAKLRQLGQLLAAAGRTL